MESIVSRFQAGRKEIWAAKSAFFISGFAFSTWVMMIPGVKQRLAIPADILGMLLLCIGLAACIAMPLAGLLTRYCTCRSLLCGAAAAISAAILLVPFLPSFWLFVPVLLLLGGSCGTLDVAINLNGVLVEQAAGKRIMSGMHAFYSVGCFAAAGLYSLLADAAGLFPPAIAAVHVGCIFALLLLFSRYYLPYRAGGGQKNGAIPRGIVIFLGLAACMSFLAEGAVMDWGGVLLTEDKGVALASAGLGFTAFSLSELLGRLCGDRVVRRFGERAVLFASTLAASLCFAAIGFAETLPMLLLFFFLLGFAVANVVPVLYTLLEHQRAMPIHAAVTALTSMGYAGVLLGPSILGFIAHLSHISVVFDALAALVFCQFLLAVFIFRRLKRE